MKYRVTGAAFVPVQIEIVVEAANESDAVSAAAIEFRAKRRDCILPGSADEGAVFDFEPSEVTPL